MESLQQAIQLIQSLPKGGKRRTIESLYPEFKSLIQQASEQIQKSEQIIFDSLSKSNLQLSLQQLDDYILKIQQGIRQQELQKQVILFSQAPLLIEFGSPDNAFKYVLQQNTLPQFIPFASYWPNCDSHSSIIKELSCQPRQDPDIRKLSSKYNGEHPYLQQIDHYELDLGIFNALGDSPAVQQFYQVKNATPGQNQSTQAKIIEESPLFFIQTNEELINACQTMSNSKIIGIDVEFSPYHTYLGNTSLLQLTDQFANDYIIDVLKVTNFNPLKDIFTDSSILKVFHGSAMNDIYWLQRDLRVFVTSLFDTAEVAMMQRERAKLQVLLQKHQILLNKEQQTSDWAIRPLTEQQLRYAREDAHWLIGLAYHQVKEESIDILRYNNRIFQILGITASNRMQELSTSVLAQLDTASSPEALETAFRAVYQDIWCRFYDKPLSQFGGDYNDIVEVLKEEVIKRSNQGQFNSAQATILLPRKHSREPQYSLQWDQVFATLCLPHGEVKQYIFDQTCLNQTKQSLVSVQSIFDEIKQQANSQLEMK